MLLRHGYTLSTYQKTVSLVRKPVGLAADWVEPPYTVNLSLH